MLLLPDEKSVFDLNAEYEMELAVTRQELWRTTPEGELRRRVADRIGLPPDAPSTAPDSERIGTIERESYVIEKYLLVTEAGVMLPTLVFRPTQPSGDARLYLHDAGKAAEANHGGTVESWVKAGKLVVTIDLSGQGETGGGESGNSQQRKQLGDWKTYYLSYLLEQPLLGRRVGDVLAAARFAAGLADEFQGQVELIAEGQVGTVALHAAALDPQRFTHVTLHDAPRDWASIVRDPNPEGMLEYVVHGALELYDLPNLVTLAGKDKIEYQP